MALSDVPALTLQAGIRSQVHSCTVTDVEWRAFQDHRVWSSFHVNWLPCSLWETQVCKEGFQLPWGTPWAQPVPVDNWMEHMGWKTNKGNWAHVPIWNLSYHAYHLPLICRGATWKCFQWTQGPCWPWIIFLTPLLSFIWFWFLLPWYWVLSRFKYDGIFNRTAS